jgi:hypothetical protein
MGVSTAHTTFSSPTDSNVPCEFTEQRFFIMSLTNSRQNNIVTAALEADLPRAELQGALHSNILY